MGVCLYSVNPWIKHFICKEVRGNIHYVWCSEHFDASKSDPRFGGTLIPPTSNPSAIYEDLKLAVARCDGHNAKITQQRAGLQRLVDDWLTKGEITSDQADDILFWLGKDGFHMWRPLVYVIPRSGIDAARLRLVPAKDRAGMGAEYIISDLAGHEFDILEP